MKTMKGLRFLAPSLCASEMKRVFKGL